MEAAAGAACAYLRACTFLRTRTRCRTPTRRCHRPVDCLVRVLLPWYQLPPTVVERLSPGQQLARPEAAKHTACTYLRASAVPTHPRMPSYAHPAAVTVLWSAAHLCILMVPGDVACTCRNVGSMAVQYTVTHKQCAYALISGSGTLANSHQALRVNFNFIEFYV